MITLADFDDPRLAAFLQAHLDDMEPTAPPESRHALDLSGLRKPSVRMFVTLDDAAPDAALVATGALAQLHPELPDGDEELKSMRTDPARRGQGLARQMVTHLIHDARARGVQRLWLETGSMDFFIPARKLYASVGFTECEPFGGYRPDPLSTFMTLRLT